MFKPQQQFIKPDCTAGYADDQIIDGFVIGYGQHVTTAIKQDFNQKPSCSFVAIHKTMIANNTVQYSRRFTGYSRMISGVGARQGRLDQVKAVDAAASAIGQSLVMRRKRICQGQSVVPSSDPTNASVLHCALSKPPSRLPQI